MSAIADTASQGDRRSFSLRAYLAGGTATSALIAGAAIVFISLAAYVAFNGIGAGADTARNHEAVVIGSGGAAAAAAAATGGAPAAVAARPAAPTAAAPVSGTPAGAAAAAGGAGTGGGSVDGGSVDGSVSSGTASSTPAASGSSGGTLDTAVGGVSNTAQNLGVNPDTSGLQNIVKPVDATVDGALNNAGGALGNQHLGEDVNQTVDGATNGLLGQGGLTDQLLGQH
ncbi:MAG: hypothetical protein ACJ75R_02205 [Solirubrobacterales bacterium]